LHRGLHWALENLLVHRQVGAKAVHMHQGVRVHDGTRDSPCSCSLLFMKAIFYHQPQSLMELSRPPKAHLVVKASPKAINVLAGIFVH